MGFFCRACDEHHSEDICPRTADRQFMRQIDAGYNVRNLSGTQRENEDRERFLGEYPVQEEPRPKVLFF